MAKKHYSAKTKAAIVEAARSTRDAGETWKQAFEAAKKVGYKGSLQGIEKMMRAMSKKTGKAMGIKRRGRKRGPKPGRKAAGLSPISAMVEKLVKARVQETLEKAIAALKAIKKG